MSTQESMLTEKLALQSYQCLTQDKMHALKIYVQLLDFQNQLEFNQMFPQSYIWQMKILSTILDMYKHVDEQKYLLSNETLHGIIMKYTRTIETIMAAKNELIKVLTENIFDLQHLSNNDLNQLAVVMNFYDLSCSNNEFQEMHNNTTSPNLIELGIKLKAKRMSKETITATIRCMVNKAKVK